MTENILSFDDLENEYEIAAFQTGLPLVVLEGRNDVDLFKRFWFPHLLESFEFVEAADVVRGSGCTAVAEAVELSRKRGIPAFGLVDRDTLFRKRRWAVMFATDDKLFADQTQSDVIYTTMRWEVEAYLFEPDLLSAWVRCNFSPPPGPEVECLKALGRTVAECEYMLAASPFFAAAHAAGFKCGDKHFLNHTGPELQAACNAGLAELTAGKEDASEVAWHLAAVQSSAPSDLAKRLDWLLRYVDTKRLLHRLSGVLSVAAGSHWTIAELMRSKARRPAELEAYLNSLQRQLRIVNSLP